MGETAWNYASIRELGQLLRSGETTPTALAEHFLERLETVGRSLNAVVTITRERALREARVAEAELAAGLDRGPLHGIPYGVKDLLATVGAPTSWGAAPYRDQSLDYDATVIARLRDAGAVLIAKLALVELAGGFGYMQANATFTGPTKNPWNADAWSGGSSSGSGAAVGAGAVPFAIGTETGRSISNPSSYCGVAGLRPSYGRVSRHGSMVLSATLDKLGPMCRTADDCGLVLDAIAGFDAADPVTYTTPYRYAPETGRRAGFRLGVLREELDGAQSEIQANFERTCEELSEFAALEDVSIPEMPYKEVFRIVLAAEGASAFDEMIESGLVSGLTAPEDRINGYPAMTLPAVDYLRAMRIRRHISRELDAVMSGYDGLVFPSTGVVALPIGANFEDYFGDSERRPIVIGTGNLAGLPNVTIPNGFGERGLPTGIQFMGRHNSENAILAIANAYQERTTWHLEHPKH